MKPPATVSAKEWLAALDAPESELFGALAKAHGGGALRREGLENCRRVLRRFVEVFGGARPVSIARVPGRLNILGRHIDHRGGFVNPIALAQEVVLVFSPNEDDLIDVVNLDVDYGRRTFRISDHEPPSPLADRHAWLDWTQGLAGARAYEGTANDWEHKLAAPPVYLAHYAFGERKFRGFSGVLGGDIPPRMGLSSSSAVVIASMLATVALNDVPLEVETLVPHCGVAEWYVGTRGGCGDHAAILCGRSGHLMRVRTVPEVEIAGYVPFPKGYRLAVFYSGCDADKTGAAGRIYNERVAAYEIADMFAARFLRERHASLYEKFAHARKHLDDPKPVHIGDVAERLEATEIYKLLETVPERATREEIRKMLPDEVDALGRQFATHTELPGGYRLRGVLTFGIAECRRAARATELLERGEVEAFGRWMNISHDGDRVSGKCSVGAVPKGRIDPTREIWEHPGSYDCSTPEIDRMVDVALSAGALGAQISAAGLGGSMIALVSADRERDVIDAMNEKYFAPQGIEPNHLSAVPSAGATLV